MDYSCKLSVVRHESKQRTTILWVLDIRGLTGHFDVDEEFDNWPLFLHNLPVLPIATVRDLDKDWDGGRLKSCIRD